MSRFLLPVVDAGHNISAITGIPNPIGSHRGPILNHPPNPHGYWWGQVLTPYRWEHVQEVGRAATERKMLKLLGKLAPTRPGEPDEQLYRGWWYWQYCMSSRSCWIAEKAGVQLSHSDVESLKKMIDQRIKHYPASGGA